MHRDQKIGLAVAVLVLGFTGAFCFRTAPPAETPLLATDQTAELDARIEQLPVRTYTQREGVGSDLSQESTSVDRAPSAHRGLADQVIRFGEPGSQQVLADGDLVDLFPGPPEPLIIDHPAEPLLMVASGPDGSHSSKLEDTSALTPAVETPPEPAVAVRAAAEEALLPPEPESLPPAGYLVRTGDTLSDIAERVYGDSRRYLDLYRANRDVLSDPDDLPVGTTLRIP